MTTEIDALVMRATARLVRIDVQDGYRRVNGRPHGFNYKPAWEVVVTFDDHESANEFFNSLHEGGICDA